jgi:hypothetical protein
MKRVHTETQRRGRSRGWRISTALAAAGLCIAAGISPARGEERKIDGGEPPIEPSLFTGDETIGTLPILQGPETIVIRRDLLIQQPSLCLEGDFDEIMASIVSVRGAAVAQVNALPVGPGASRSDRVQVIFPGNVQLGFDRLLIESSSIQVGVWMPERTRAGSIEFVWNSRLGTIPAESQLVHLPVLSMSAVGALSYAPFLAHAQGALGSTYVTAATGLDTLVLRQTH